MYKRFTKHQKITTECRATTDAIKTVQTTTARPGGRGGGAGDEGQRGGREGRGGEARLGRRGRLAGLGGPVRGQLSQPSTANALVYTKRNATWTRKVLQ